MGIKDKFVGFGRYCWGLVLRVVRPGEASLYGDLLTIASTVVEVVGQVDLNGDGRIAAKAEIAQAAQYAAAGWGRKFADAAKLDLLDRIDEDDLRRWLAVAKITMTLIASRIDMPKTRTINLAIETALDLLSRR